MGFYLGCGWNWIAWNENISLLFKYYFEPLLPFLIGIMIFIERIACCRIKCEILCLPLRLLHLTLRHVGLANQKERGAKQIEFRSPCGRGFTVWVTENAFFHLIGCGTFFQNSSDPSVPHGPTVLLEINTGRDRWLDTDNHSTHKVQSWLVIWTREKDMIWI